MKISLILPCYNEEVNLQKGVLDKIGNFTKNDKRFTEVLVVDDGSTDKSREIIQDKYLSHFPKIKLLVNAHQGKAYTLITGIQQAKNKYVIFSDIDLATPLEEVEKLIEQVEHGFSIVIGSRKSRRAGASVSRKIMALGAIFIREVLIGIRGIHDTQCGFKLFKRDQALNIIKRLQVFNNAHPTRGSSVAAGFDIEFLFIASRLRYKIKEVPVVWRHVETKNVHFLKDSFEALSDILKIKYYDLTGKYNF